jgi:hypothetical protein
MPVIPVNRLVDKIKIIGKNEGRGGGEVQGVADPPPHTHTPKICVSFILFTFNYSSPCQISLHFLVGMEVCHRSACGSRQLNKCDGMLSMLKIIYNFSHQNKKRRK